MYNLCTINWRVQSLLNRINPHISFDIVTTKLGKHLKKQIASAQTSVNHRIHLQDMYTHLSMINHCPWLMRHGKRGEVLERAIDATGKAAHAVDWATQGKSMHDVGPADPHGNHAKAAHDFTRQTQRLRRAQRDRRRESAKAMKPEGPAQGRKRSGSTGLPWRRIWNSRCPPSLGLRWSRGPTRAIVCPLRTESPSDTERLLL